MTDEQKRETFDIRFHRLKYDRDIAIMEAEDTFKNEVEALYQEMVKDGLLQPGDTPPWLTTQPSP